MEKFIQTVASFYTKEKLDFYKAVSFLNSYACTCRDQVPFLVREEETIGFTLVLRGLIKETPLLWQKEVISICEATAETLIAKKVFSSKEEFYSVLGQPISKKQIQVEKMEEIFNAMSEIIEKRFSEISDIHSPETILN